MFLPLTKQELRERGWDRPDFICVTGDAYVDHPSFGIAIVSRLLESLGYRVAMIAQPVSDADYLRFGAPKYGWWVTRRSSSAGWRRRCAASPTTTTGRTR